MNSNLHKYNPIFFIKNQINDAVDGAIQNHQEITRICEHVQEQSIGFKKGFNQIYHQRQGITK